MLSLARSAMPAPPPDELEVPRYSSGCVLSLDEIESATLRHVACYWSGLRGGRRFPSRQEFEPKNLKGLLRHVTLVKVINSGADYEFRVMGDVQVQAYGSNFAGMRLSQVAVRHEKFAEGLRVFYEGVRMGREAFGYRGWIGRDMPDTKYSYHECAFFPLGTDGEVVDHILVAGVYVPRGSGRPG
ncbi:MAG TPA: PAS domain-containing protein [Rhizomicrobium sp.]|nr:PAS domain-containing protein [Rhizomicrobium sp.]